MHLLQATLVLALAALPLTLAAPKPSPFNLNPLNPPAGPSANITNNLNLPVAPNQKPLRDPNAPPPKQIKKNCKGSGMCPMMTEYPCQQASYFFDDNLIYRNKTSYSYSEGKFSGSKCTAIFVCEDGMYGDGLTGGQIKKAFSRLWQPDKSQKNCDKCGSSYLEGGCHVTANYCNNCKNKGAELAVPLNPKVKKN